MQLCYTDDGTAYVGNNQPPIKVYNVFQRYKNKRTLQSHEEAYLSKNVYMRVISNRLLFTLKEEPPKEKMEYIPPTEQEKKTTFNKIFGALYSKKEFRFEMLEDRSTYNTNHVPSDNKTHRYKYIPIRKNGRPKTTKNVLSFNEKYYD